MKIPQHENAAGFFVGCWRDDERKVMVGMAVFIGTAEDCCYGFGKLDSEMVRW